MCNQVVSNLMFISKKIQHTKFPLRPKQIKKVKEVVDLNNKFEVFVAKIS